MSVTLSEAASKRLLADHGVPVAAEVLVGDAPGAGAAADTIGYPVVAKLCGDAIAHKTERGLVRLSLRSRAEVEAAATELLGAATPEDGEVAVLLAPMVSGTRELIAGLHRDPTFGMTVMVGIGGVLAEAVADVSVRLVPIDAGDAHEMIDELAAQALLGAFRGEPAVDRDAVAGVLCALSAAAVAVPELRSADLNPLIISDGMPVAVDALVELDEAQHTEVAQ